MDLGQFASYRIPAKMQNAFGVETAQQLAEYLGVRGEFSPGLTHDAEEAYLAYKNGDIAAARAFAKNRLGMTDPAIDSAFSKLNGS